MNQSLKAKTMRRVVAVYYLRKILNPITLKTGILLMGALAFGSLVHVAAIFANMPAYSDIVGLYSFSYSAFTHTEIAVQATILLSVFVTLWLARDVVQGFAPRFHTGYSHA